MPKEQLLEQLAKKKAEPNYPKVVVSGSGTAWFLNPDTRSMERVYRGSVVQRVSPAVDKTGRHLVRLGSVYILIPEEELFEVGEN